MTNKVVLSTSIYVQRPWLSYVWAGFFSCWELLGFWAFEQLVLLVLLVALVALFLREREIERERGKGWSCCCLVVLYPFFFFFFADFFYLCFFRCKIKTKLILAYFMGGRAR